MIAGSLTRVDPAHVNPWLFCSSFKERSRSSSSMYRLLLITACFCAARTVRHPRSTTLGIENSHLMSGINVNQILNYPTSSSGHAVFPGDCAGLPKGKRSGLYIVQPEISRRLVVYCDMKVEDGGWTVVQKNSYNSKLTWNNGWVSYKRGFGDAKGDHWLGNDNIRLLTKQKLYMVRFLLRDAIGQERFADYDLFRLEDEKGCYRLRLGRYSGTAPDALTTDVVHAAHDNMKFSTYNQDNDRSQENCASIGGGGWWYDNCRYANLNANNKIYWQGICPGNCQSSEILIKPVDVCGDDDNGGGDNGGGDGGGDNGGGDGGGDNGGGDGGGDNGGGDGGGDNGGGEDVRPTPC